MDDAVVFGKVAVPAGDISDDKQSLASLAHGSAASAGTDGEASGLNLDPASGIVLAAGIVLDPLVGKAALTSETPPEENPFGKSISSMKVVELRDALRYLGISATGAKAELVRRLRLATEPVALISSPESQLALASPSACVGQDAASPTEPLALKNSPESLSPTALPLVAFAGCNVPLMLRPVRVPPQPEAPKRRSEVVVL